MTTHLWEQCVNLKALPKNRAAQIEQTMNWLEKHFPEFNEMIYEIHQGQKKGQLKKINFTLAIASEYEDTRMFPDQGIFRMDFKPMHYLGTDGKAYEWSLNELVAHELEHFAQTTRTPHKSLDREWNQKRTTLQEAAANLKTYLKSHNIKSRDDYKDKELYYKEKINNRNFIEFHDYVQFAELAEPDIEKKLSPAILADPQFKKASQKWLNAFKALRDVEIKYQENEAVDRQNILSQILGKAPRGTYFDYDQGQMQDFLGSLSKKLVVYTESPEEIRQHGIKPVRVPKDITFTPFAHGKAGVRSTDILKVQREWDNKWNTDTKNITSEEWRVIEKVKGTLLSVEILKTITPDQKKEVDKVIDTLKQDFNKTKDKDPLSEASQAALVEKGMNDLAAKTSQKGWKL